MSVQVKRRREAAAYLATYIGAAAELLVDTTNNRVQVHDGVTPGGSPAAKLSEVGQLNAANIFSASQLTKTASGVGAGFGSQISGDTNARAILGLDGNDKPYVGFGRGSGAADIVFRRDAASALSLLLGGSLAASFTPQSVAFAGCVSTGSATVASLPSAATVGGGARMFVTDATSASFLSVVVGGGSNEVPVVSNGANWLIG